MSRKLAGIAAALLFMSLLSAVAGPRGGGFGRFAELSSGSKEDPAVTTLDEKLTFVVGQRAAVIVTGRQSGVPPGELGLRIRDEKGQIVASDDGAYNLAAIWYPSRDMTCSIQILNYDSYKRRVFVTVK